MELSAMHFVQLMSQSAANALASGIWDGFLLVLATALCLKIAPRTSAASRFTIWLTIFLTLLLLPFALASRASQVFGVSDIRPNGALLHVDVRWSFAIAAAWIAASLFRATRLGLNAMTLRQVWKSATPLTEAPRSDQPWFVTRTGGDRQRGSRALVCSSTIVERPSMIGFFSPRILIPEWLLEELTPAELEHLILHETEHLRRRDDWINLLQKVGLVLFPLNPVLLWLEARLCFERELACDDGVLHSTGAPRAYATCLTSLAERSLTHRAASLALGAWERRSSLAHRVHRILRPEQVLRPLQARRVTGAAVAALVVGGVCLSQAPQLVSFSDSAQPVERLSIARTESTAVPATTHIEPRRAAAYPPATLQNAAITAIGPISAAFRTTSLNSSFLNSTSLSISRTSSVQSTARTVSKRTKPSRALLRRTNRVTDVNQDWIVVTSWDMSISPDVVFTVMTDRPALTPDFSVPPAVGDWIFFQL